MQTVTQMAVACPNALAGFASFTGGPQLTEELPWFALQVRQTGRELCEQLLEYIGVEFFSPCVAQRRQWSDRQKTIQSPLFPGYIFCRFDPERRLPVLQVPGVLGIVSAGRRMLPVDPSEIASIRRAVEARLPLETVPYLCTGDRVTISSGPLAGLQGIVERTKGSTRGAFRLLLSVSMLNRSVSVEIGGAEVL